MFSYEQDPNGGPLTLKTVLPPSGRFLSSFPRPADTTQYATGDLIANSVTAGAVVPTPIAVARRNGGTGQLLRAKLMKSGPSLTNASFRVHIFQAAPTLTLGDNSAYTLTTGVVGDIGDFDVTMDRTFGDGALGRALPNTGSVIVFNAASTTTNLYWLLEALGAYTPLSAEVFTLVLEAVLD